MGESREPTSIGEGGLKDLLWPPGLQTLPFVEWSLVAFEVRESCLLPGSFLPWKIRVPSLPQGWRQWDRLRTCACLWDSSPLALWEVPEMASLSAGPLKPSSFRYTAVTCEFLPAVPHPTQLLEP